MINHFQIHSTSTKLYPHPLHPRIDYRILNPHPLHNCIFSIHIRTTSAVVYEHLIHNHSTSTKLYVCYMNLYIKDIKCLYCYIAFLFMILFAIAINIYSNQLIHAYNDPNRYYSQSFSNKLIYIHGDV